MNHLELYIVLVKARTCESPGFLLEITEPMFRLKPFLKPLKQKTKVIWYYCCNFAAKWKLNKMKR